MSLQNFSKKALAVVLSVAMLASCMVFSFSASAADTLLWENDFNDTTAPWYSALGDQSSRGPYNSGTVGRTDLDGGNYAVYDNGAMKLGFASVQSRVYMSGFTVRHKTATTKGAIDTYGGGGAAKWDHNMGAFSPTAGKYKIELDYKLNELIDDASTILDICVGFANSEAFYWDDDRYLDYFGEASRRGTYQVAASVKLSDLGMDWAHATVYKEITGNDDNAMYVFLVLRDYASNPIGSVLVDNIKVTKIDTIPDPGADPDPNPNPNPDPDPTPTPSDKLHWENDFNDATASNWGSAYKGEADGGLWNSGTVKSGVYNGSNYAVYKPSGYMSLGYKAGGGANNRHFLSGFTVLNQTATTDANAGGENASYGRRAMGFFRPTIGKYKVEFQYMVKSFIESPHPRVDICVGYAKGDNFQWDGDRDIARFTRTTGAYPEQGVYEIATNVGLADVSAEWKTATVYLDMTTDSNYLHIFLKNGTPDGAVEDYLDGTEVLIDNIKVTEVDEIPAPGPGGEPDPGPGGEPDPGPGGEPDPGPGGEPDPGPGGEPDPGPGGEPDPGPGGEPDPTPDPDVRWENDFNNISAPWYSVLKSASGKGNFNSGMVGRTDGEPAGDGNYAVYDNGAMKLGFASWSSRVYMSGFTVRHKTATTPGAVGVYGGGGAAAERTNDGAFSPTAGKYKIELDYKLDDLVDDASTILDICVGFAKAESFFWDNNRYLDYFVDPARGGTYQVAASVRLSDLGEDWAHATLYTEITGSEDRSMHIFLVNRDHDSNPEGSVLIDNIKVTEVDEIPAPGPGDDSGSGEGGVPQPPQYDGPILMWKNTFENGNSTNWASVYGGKEDGSYWNSGKVHTDVKNYSVIRKDGSNSVMSLGFANEAARSKISGFVFLHEDRTHNLAGQYGYGGGMAGTNYGRVFATPGYYTISFDYKLKSINRAKGAEFDVGLSFCNDLLLDSEAGVDETRLSAFKGDPKRLFTVTASDLGKDWRHYTFDLANLTPDSMFLYFYIVANNNYEGSLENSELLIDNIEIRMHLDESKFTKITFYHEGEMVGESAGSMPGMYFVMPELNLPEIPQGYKIVYYSDPECKNMIAAPVAHPQKSMDIYLRIVQDTGNTWGFETEANDTRLSIETLAPQSTIDTDNAFSHSGSAAARVNSDDKGSPNLYAQMMVKNGFNKQVSVASGRKYEISFYLYVPADQTPYDIKYWFAATEADKAFDKNYNASYSAKNYLVAEGTASIPKAGEWVKVQLTVDDCKLDGKLRMGLVGDGDPNHPFYIDDVLVVSVPADPNAWSFETEPNDTLLSLNARVPETTIYTDNTSAVFSGVSAARVTSDGGLGSPNLWPQMLVKNGAGEQVYVYKSRSYEVRMLLFIPTGQPGYDVSIWLAATEEETEFNKEYEHEYSMKFYNVAEAAYTPAAVGDWVEVVIPIENCAHTGKLRIGFNGCGLANYPFYIDDLLVREVTKEPDVRVESYERYDLGKKLSLNTDGALITVSDEDRLSGDYSAKIVTRGNNINAAPQMVVSDAGTKPVKVEKGKSYHISFYICVPITQPDYDVKYWLAVTDSASAFTTERKNVVVDTKTAVIKDKQAWQIVRMDINNCAYTGTLRLGITGSSDEAHTFYLDDIYVREIQPADPNAMNFEMYEPGTTLHLNEDNNTFTVTDAESYTGGQSVLVHADNNHENRPQMLIKDAKGNQVKVKKGDNFYVTFMVYIPETEPYFNFSYYVAATPDGDESNRAFRYRSSFVSTNYKLGGQEWVTPPPVGVWTQIKIAVLDCPLDGNLRIGLCHGNGHPFQSNFYVDDIKVYEPEYVLVKFDTNGSEDKFEDMLLLSDMLIPYDGVDPYREGYEFMGWYTSKNFDKDSFFDIYTMPVIGKTGDVITLYACWRQWEVAVADKKEEQTEEYEVEYYTEKVWVGNQEVPEMPYTRGEFEFGDAAPVDKAPADTAPIPENDAMPPWLLVVIIVAAVVVVGGGSTLAAILLKKSKKA